MKDLLEVKDDFGDTARVIEWESDPATIGCVQFANNGDVVASVHLDVISAIRLGNALIALAKRHGADDGGNDEADVVRELRDERAMCERWKLENRVLRAELAELRAHVDTRASRATQARKRRQAPRRQE